MARKPWFCAGFALVSHVFAPCRRCFAFQAHFAHAPRSQSRAFKRFCNCLKKYIFKPCKLGENKVGVELNFNKEFYVPEKLDSVEDILAEIKALDAELKEVKL